MASSASDSVLQVVRQAQAAVDSVVKDLSPTQRKNVQAVLFLAGLSSVVKHKKAAALSLAVNLAVFSLHAWPNRSDKFYDTTGALTHLSLALFSILNQKKRISHGQTLNTIFSIMWITRLGSFLYTRILTQKKDVRFKDIKQNFDSFMMSFVLQSIWCYLGQLPLLVSNSNEDKEDKLTWSTYDILGRALFVVGFVFEVVSDAQKTAFNADPKNHGRFINEGLWSISRHPNHFGEICLQFGIALSASRTFKNRTDRLAWLGPIFTTFLLTKVSGIPMLEKIGMERWGSDAEYLKYLRTVPMLIPRIL